MGRASGGLQRRRTGFHEKFRPARKNSLWPSKPCCKRFAAISTTRCIDWARMYPPSFAVYIALGITLKLNPITFGGNMIATFSKTLKKYANGRIILAFLALVLLFAVVIVPTVQGKLEASSGGSGPIDLLFSYTPEKAYSIIESFGDTGRSLYRTFAMTADIIYPVVYSLFFSLLISWLFQRSFSSTSKLQILNVLPFGACLFDWLENINIITMLTLYPTKSNTVAELASLCTTIKWSFGVVSFLIVLVGLMMALKNKFKKQA